MMMPDDFPLDPKSATAHRPHARPVTRETRKAALLAMKELRSFAAGLRRLERKVARAAKRAGEKRATRRDSVAAKTAAE